jgi:hypothetical protein
MGDEADRMVDNFTSGRWGTRMSTRSSTAHPRTTRRAIADKVFAVVEVTGFATNRIQGTKLIVCDNDEQNYWVWASSGVTGIRKAVCTVLQADLPLAEALRILKRKPYVATSEPPPARPSAPPPAPEFPSSVRTSESGSKLPPGYKPKAYGRSASAAPAVLPDPPEFASSGLAKGEHPPLPSRRPRPR